jgi:hypothetical protein
LKSHGEEHGVVQRVEDAGKQAKGKEEVSKVKSGPLSDQRCGSAPFNAGGGKQSVRDEGASSVEGGVVSACYYAETSLTIVTKNITKIIITY